MCRVAWIFCFFLLAIVIGFVPPASADSNKELVGAGATFPYPLYHKMFDAYSRQYGVKITYNAIGSGGGIEQIIAKKVDFAGSDAFMTEKELEEARVPIIHIPTCLGAVTITYNLPSNPKIRLTPDLITDVFLGKIKRWNDPKIVDLNRDVRMPDMGITVIYRSDESGTTFILNEYLSKANREWRERVGVGKSLPLSVGRKAKGNPGVAGLVEQIPGSIGYVELIYALGNNMAIGVIKNRSGKFVEPTTESVSSSAHVSLPEDTHISLTDTSAPDGYPISSFTWLMVYREQNYGGRAKERAKELGKLLWWMVHAGQRHTTMLHYSPLPEEAVKKAENLLTTLTYDGSRLLR